MKATRLTNKTYYNKGFEGIVITAALTCRGKLKPIRDALRARWMETKDAVPTLLTSSSCSYSLREVLFHIFNSPSVQQTLTDLKQRATDRGEWVAVSHDATFKCLFSLMVQYKMAQQQDECHTDHTFLGVTGACPGFSPQATEGDDDF